MTSAQPLPVAATAEGLHSVTFESGGRLFWAGWTCSECPQAAVRLCGVSEARVYGPAELAAGTRPRTTTSQDGIQVEVKDELSLVEIITMQ